MHLEQIIVVEVFLLELVEHFDGVYGVSLRSHVSGLSRYPEMYVAGANGLEILQGRLNLLWRLIYELLFATGRQLVYLGLWQQGDLRLEHAAYVLLMSHGCRWPLDDNDG